MSAKAPRSTVERLAVSETMLDHLTDSVDELKDRVKAVEKSLASLDGSQRVQLQQLQQVLDNLAKLQTTATQTHGAVSLSTELAEAAKSMGPGRLKKLVGAGMAIAAVLYGVYSSAVEMAKPNADLANREGHSAPK